MLEVKYKIVRTPAGPERRLVTDAAVLKDWKRYLRDTVGGSISIEQIGE